MTRQIPDPKSKQSMVTRHSTFPSSLKEYGLDDEENSDDEEDEKSSPLSESYRQKLKEKNLRILTSAKIENHTKIFASMCPDEILDHVDDYNTREYYTTLMLGDVSGFTDLTEKYTKTGQGGPSKLTEILNSYIGAMVQEILSHKGDVLKFSGDAFIVMWKVGDDMVMRDVAVEAMQTACIIQKHFGTLDTDVGVVLRVKLAIASGKISFTSIGDPEIMAHYIITGNPVWDVKVAEGLCRGGDIIVAPSSWQWANPNDYVYESLPDGAHTLLLATTVMWEPDSERYGKLDPESETDGNTSEDQNIPLLKNFATDRVPDLDAAPVLMNLTGETLADYRRWQVDYSLRPKVTKVAKAHMKNSLRCYMLRPIIHAVEMDEPIEYLTEMRQIVIVFVNVITKSVSHKKLIPLVDNAFKIVCGIVDSTQGCVNKTSLFDKDLMFLCIFGLRGDKHELESQIGLRCAAKIYASLKARKNIGSVAIGVTTGMTYCGVVGHILRREYTVIGMAVNKAARLMCAYPNRVVCDRDSFLRSRLEARHFILQEPKYLKGITNIGPIYEFFEQTGSENPDPNSLSKYPILGRESELNTFIRILVNAMNFQATKNAQPNVKLTCNVLVIRGEPRSGKTRLLDEMVRQIPSSTVSCYRISLIQNDHKVPYSLAYLILSIPLGFTISSTPKEREEKIVDQMGKIHFPDLLCSLNDILNVNFDVSDKYRALPGSDKQEITEKLLSKLISKIFHRQWVVVIDDAEYSDPETVAILPTIIKEDHIFFVMAFGQKVSTEFTISNEILKKAELIDLPGLDKWYHAGLACQILGVKAISAELEKVIQEKSSGNPGWIESYLVCLMQSGDLLKNRVNKNQLGRLGLVCPPDDMIQRPIADRPQNLESTEQNSTDGWTMYQSSYKESAVNLVTDINKPVTEVPSNLIYEVSSSPSNITICVTSPTFVTEDSDIELKMDVIILKMFDSLSPLDQLLLKSAAILGETFNRYMLENILEITSEREFGLAIKRLFEMKILGCAIGDFKRTPGPVVLLRKFRISNMDTEVRCDCTGITISEACADLPNYASCGLIRFKISTFRDTMYRLLTENHKVEIHEKALKYLQQNTRRCSACGEGHFSKLLGVRYDDDQRGKKSHDETINYLKNLADFPVERYENNFEIGAGIVEEEIPRTCCLAVFKPVKKSPTRKFSNVDFSECQCNLILSTMYTQVVDHCRSIGHKDKMLVAILEFVEISLSSCNIPQARKLLQDGEAILDKMKLSGDEDDAVTLPCLRGKIYTLQGRCFFESGQLKEAHNYLNEAIKSLGYNFPTTLISIKLKALILMGHQKIMMSCLRNFTVGNVEGYAADFSDQLANCLAQLFKLCKANGWWNHCRLAAIWGLNSALKSDQDFFTLCTAYSQMIIVAHRFRYRSMIPVLEKHAINVCCRKEDAVELQELEAVAKLYYVIFGSRWMRGKVNLALSVGFKTMKICHTIRSVALKLSLLPTLIHILFIKCQYSDVAFQLNELESIANNDTDKSGKTWFYAFCAEFQLEFGLTVVTFRKCEEYYQEAGKTIKSLRDPAAEKRYFTNMWLWCVRNGDWEAATVWGSKIPAFSIQSDEHSGIDCLTATKKLEGLLILYVHRLDTRNAKANVATHKEILRLIKEINVVSKSTYITSPRYLLMKAYYCMIKNRRKKAMRLIKESKKYASAQDNKMIYRWATHSAQVWDGTMNPIKGEFWKEHCTLDSALDWHEVDMNTYKPVPYSLPLPKYPN